MLPYFSFTGAFRDNITKWADQAVLYMEGSKDKGIILSSQPYKAISPDV